MHPLGSQGVASVEWRGFAGTQYTPLTILTSSRGIGSLFHPVAAAVYGRFTGGGQLPARYSGGAEWEVATARTAVPEGCYPSYVFLGFEKHHVVVTLYLLVIPAPTGSMNSSTCPPGIIPAMGCAGSRSQLLSPSVVLPHGGSVYRLPSPLT